VDVNRALLAADLDVEPLGGEVPANRVANARDDLAEAHGLHLRRVRLRGHARDVLDDDGGARPGGLDVNLDRQRGRARIEAQIGERRQHPRSRREPLPENLVRPLAGR
jgi:hypothetical protein